MRLVSCAGLALRVSYKIYTYIYILPAWMIHAGVQCSLYWTRSRAEAGTQLEGCLGPLLGRDSGSLG